MRKMWKETDASVRCKIKESLAAMFFCALLFGALVCVGDLCGTGPTLWTKISLVGFLVGMAGSGVCLWCAVGEAEECQDYGGFWDWVFDTDKRHGPRPLE